jgi:hypothetical protein
MRQVAVKPKNAQSARRLVKFALFFNLTVVLTLCPMAMYGADGIGMTLLLALLVDVPIAVYAISQELPFVWQCEHTFTKVCRGLGGNFEYEAFSLANSIRKGMESGGRHYVGNQTKTVYPTLRSVTVSGSREAWTGLVKPNPGQTVDHFNANAAAFALAYQVEFVAFEIAPKGLIAIRAGRVPVPPAYDYDFEE